MQEIVDIFKTDIIFSPTDIHVRGNKLLRNGYCIFVDNKEFCTFSKINFEKSYTEYIPDRIFKCDKRIMIHLWKEVLRVPGMYTVSVIDGFITLTGNATGNKVKISEVLTVTRMNPKCSLNSIEQKIISMCKEI